ncbi:MAG: hypothetical protein BRD48_01185 [Bacteroidetes bacterium QS_9_68_14]|nr:MAG: hypothetical protein BRD48_01185 [Bacteroidetes bacterium QS_9_68_14]
MPSEATTFSLEATAPGPVWNRPTRNLRRLRYASVRRVAFFGIGGVLATGSAAALFYAAGAAGGWWLTLAVGLVLLARASHLWRRRPSFLRLSERGLTFRLAPLSAKHTVDWGELARLDLELKDARLHRTGDAPTMHLRFDALPGDTPTASPGTSLTPPAPVASPSTRADLSAA